MLEIVISSLTAFAFVGVVTSFGYSFSSSINRKKAGLSFAVMGVLSVILALLVSLQYSYVTGFRWMVLCIVLGGFGFAVSKNRCRDDRPYLLALGISSAIFSVTVFVLEEPLLIPSIFIGGFLWSVVASITVVDRVREKYELVGFLKAVTYSLLVFVALNLIAAFFVFLIVILVFAIT